MSLRSRHKSKGVVVSKSIFFDCRMDQPGPSSQNVFPETPESPTGSNSSDVSTNDMNIFPRVGIEIPIGIGVEYSSEDEYEEPSLEEENVNIDRDDNDGLVNEDSPVDNGFEEGFIGDSNITLCSRHDVNMLRGWRAFVLDQRNCAGFLVSEPPIPER